MDQTKERGKQDDPSSFFEDMFTRLCIDEQRTFATELDVLDRRSSKLHHELLEASRKAHEQVYRAAEAERIRAEELERRERLQRITKPPDPLPPPPAPPSPPAHPAPAPVQTPFPATPAPSVTPAPPASSVTSASLQFAPSNLTTAAPAQQPLSFSRAAPVPAKPSPSSEKAFQDPVKTQQASEQVSLSQHALSSDRQRIEQNQNLPGKKSPALSAPPAEPPKIQVNGISRTTTDRRVRSAESTHEQFLDIHQRLKEMRRSVVSYCKQNPQAKGKLGDMRRDINTRVGQLSTDKAANKKAIERIQMTLTEARRIQEPKVDMAKFLITPPKPMMLESGVFAYLLSILSKKIIAQLAEEAGRDTKRAEPIGTMAATVFSTDSLKLEGQPLVDILVAKYHVVCPVLFGIRGNEETKNGRRRLGWLEEDKGSGRYISENAHNDRMTGLGAGYASLSLRDFSKSTRRNPYPSYHFWRALSRILNTPPREITTTHVVILRGMLENYIPRFIRFYGHPGYVALRKALNEFPAHAPQGPALSSLKVLKDILKRDEHLTIT
ncbi:GLE1-domain-containing protein [Viridothelium virens]|uniref:mRNA export factor GLE1 n=1 Tax=Viridothelium virens TaxID=1048519 RepID=A0A6A6H3Q0_VIRVR|nr:GLE1-domain-containing protein [Viridothelium virens]